MDSLRRIWTAANLSLIADSLQNNYMDKSVFITLFAPRNYTPVKGE
jgi:hypothetical protein